MNTDKTSPTFLRSSALALVTFMAVLIPSAATANSYVRPDAAKDVVKYATANSSSSTKVPDRTFGDVLSSSVGHGKRRVNMAMRADELTQTGDGATFLFRIGTKHKIRRLYIETSPGHWQGVGYFLRDTNSGDSLKCRGIGWSIDYGTDLVRASVPRKCLGKPKWVHVGMATATFEDPAIFLDDAGTNGYIGDAPKWGPRVYR